MKNASLILNAILLVAVAHLYYLHFSNKIDGVWIIKKVEIQYGATIFLFWLIPVVGPQKYVANLVFIYLYF